MHTAERTPLSQYSNFEDISGRRLFLALLLSLLSHVLLLLWLQAPSFHRSRQTPIEVRLIRDASPAPKQIVSPSAIETPNETALRLSEKDSKTETEQIRRGTEGQAQSGEDVGASQQKQQSKPQPQLASVSKPQPSPNPERTQSEPKPKAAPSPSPEAARERTQEPVLHLSQRALSAQLAQGSTRQEPPSEEKRVSNELREVVDYTPFRRSINPAVSGRLGSPDYLPTIQDGEITLLNAKADRYAVFVRRVALQVFGILRRKSWSNLSRGQIYQLQQFTEVRAVLNPDGTLNRVELGGSSGVQEFDVLLQESARQGAWDKNPPSGAQFTDGKIHFVFRAKTWSRPAAGGVGEQRWLLLSTGLL